MTMKVMEVPFSKVKTHLSEYGRRAQTGATTVVLKHHQPAFVIAPVPSRAEPAKKRPGLAAGKIHMAADFDRTPEEIVAAFEGDA